MTQGMKFKNIHKLKENTRSFFEKVLCVFNEKNLLYSTHTNIELRVHALVLLRDYKPNNILFRSYDKSDFYFPQTDDRSKKQDKVRAFNKLCFYILHPNAPTVDDGNKEIRYPSESEDTISSYIKNQYIAQNNL